MIAILARSGGSTLDRKYESGSKYQFSIASIVNKNFNFDGFSKEKSIFKATKKKNKALFGTKLALFGAALTGAAYLIKEAYDFFVESPKFTKFKKDLENFLPSSIKFYDSGSKTINGNPSSFILTTKNGEEISITKIAQILKVSKEEAIDSIKKNIVVKEETVEIEDINNIEEDKLLKIEYA